MTINPCTVAVIHENPSVVQTIIMILDEAGLAPYPFTSCDLATNWLQSHRVDAVIAGISDRKPECIAIYSMFKALFPHLPVLLLADGGDEDVQKHRSEFPEIYLTLPIRPHELVERLSMLIPGCGCSLDKKMNDVAEKPY